MGIPESGSRSSITQQERKGPEPNTATMCNNDDRDPVARAECELNVINMN